MATIKKITAMGGADRQELASQLRMATRKLRDERRRARRIRGIVQDKAAPIEKALLAAEASGLPGTNAGALQLRRVLDLITTRR